MFAICRVTLNHVPTVNKRGCDPEVVSALCHLTAVLTPLADKIERVQWQFTKCLAGLKRMSYHDRLRVLGLESLERRRFNYDLILGPDLQKILDFLQGSLQGKWDII